MNVKDDPEVTDTTDVSRDVAATVTSPDGWVASFTVNVAVEPSLTGTVVGFATRPATSSSSTLTVTVSDTDPKPPPEPVRSTTVESLSASSSCTPATVTVCAVAQSPVVNVKDDPEVTDTTDVSRDVAATVTSPVGWVASFTVNVAVEPSLTGTVVGFATRPEESSSSTLTVTVSDTEL